MILGLLRAFLVALLTGLLSFGVIRTLLPEPSSTLLSRHAQASERETLRSELGYQRAWPLAYLDVLNNYAHGNFGRAWTNGEPIGVLLATRLKTSLALMLPGALLSHLLALLWALRVRSGLASLLSHLSMAAGLLLTTLAVQWALCAPSALAWFPVFGLDLSSPASYLHGVVAPSLALCLGSFGSLYPFYRATFARARFSTAARAAQGLGLRGWRLLRARFAPTAGVVVARLMYSLPVQILAGSVVVESVFGVPGMGKRGFEAALASDAPLLVAISMLCALCVACSVALGEWLSAILDPRLRVSTLRNHAFAARTPVAQVSA